MSRPRKSAIPLVVDVNGVEVPAVLRPPRTAGASYKVRWKMHGVSRERTTGTQSLDTAKRIARQIIRGEEPAEVRRRGDGMTVAEFEAIQKKHYGLADSDSAGMKSWKAFHGVWASFLKVCPIKVIQEVTESDALDYLERLKTADRNMNHNYKKSRSAKLMSIGTIRKHIRTLAGAWNRIRDGHPEQVAGLAKSKRATENPWEAVHNNAPKLKRKGDPVQFRLDNGDLVQFLDTFQSRPIAELFVIASLWCTGRIEEMASMEWAWFTDDYIVIPDTIAKRGKGKVVRIPSAIRERLESFRVEGSPYVFAGFAGEVERSLKSCHTVKDFSPSRMLWRMQKLIKQGAEAIGRPEITHHALRRTGHELTNEGELRDKRKASASKLQTTVSNMTRNYLAKVGKKERLLADGLYENMTVALQDYPVLAGRLGCEPVENAVEREMEEMMTRLTPIQRRRLQKRLAEGGDAGEGQGVA
jgi:integrase